MVRFSKGEYQGEVDEEIASVLPPLLFALPFPTSQERLVEVLKDSRLRWAAVLTFEDGRRMFLKRNRTKDSFEALKHLLLPSKAKREWEVAKEAERRGLPVPKPLGWIERRRFGLLQESIYLSEAVKSEAVSAEEVLKDAPSGVIQRFARTVRAIHDQGIYHLDLHAGNLLWDGERFLLIDLHRARILKGLSQEQRLRNMAQIFHSLRSFWGERERTFFLRGYLGDDPSITEERGKALERVSLLMDRLQKRQWASRTKRCLKESTEFTVLKVGEIRGYHRRELSAEALESLIERHQQFVKARTRELVKDALEVSVTLFEDGGKRVAIKAFREPHALGRFKDRFRTPKGLRAWVAGNGLKVRGFPCPKALAYVEKGGCLGLREAFLIMEASDRGLEMDRYLCVRVFNRHERRVFIQAFARWLSDLHLKGVYHRDMKACNLLVEEEERGRWLFLPLDLEDIDLDTRIDEAKVFRNFLQLNTSIPGSVTWKNRLRFLGQYSRMNPVIRDRKAFLRRLDEASRRRGVVYVSPEGVVEERFPSSR